jgi:hypothetical protein
LIRAASLLGARERRDLYVAQYPGNAILSRNAYVIQSSAGDPGEVSLSSEDNSIEPFSFEKGSRDIQFAFELSNPALRTIVRVALWISR